MHPTITCPGLQGKADMVIFKQEAYKEAARDGEKYVEEQRGQRTLDQLLPHLFLF